MGVEVRGLTRRYGARVALAQVSLDAPPGGRFAVVGPNGSGKSTLFRILSTALEPSEGTFRVAGIEGRDPRAVRRKLGVVFQSPALDRKLTVRENLLHHGHLYGLRGAALGSRIGEVLERFRVADRAADRVETLSGGLQRRAEIAKALVPRPEVLLLDEPSTGLDPEARRELDDALRGLEGVTVLLTTHLLEEAERCDRVAVLDEGRVVAAGTPEELCAGVEGETVAVRAREAEGLAAAIRERFGTEAVAAGGEVRMSVEGGHAFAARLAEAFPGRLDSVTVSRPTLEDVYFRRTRRRWS